MEPILFYAPTVRLYYNKTGDPAKCWSVDFGEGTIEILCVSVAIIASGKWTGWTCTCPDADNKYAPRAWMLFQGVTIKIIGMRVEIR
jgi:hypothetical protein